MTRKCRYCSIEFEPVRSTQLDCSPKCRHRWHQAMSAEKSGKTVYDRVCPKCGRTFRTPKESEKLCIDCRPRKKRDYNKKPKKSKKSMIVEINELARESGMSYGKYVAMQSMKSLERK